MSTKPPPLAEAAAPEEHWEGPLRLYTPLQVLQPVAEGVWIVDGPVVRMAAVGLQVPFPTRMTLIRLASGGLWVHSPIALSEQLRAQLEPLGPVAHLVSPNKIHYAHIRAWKEVYPQATAWASPGVRERAAQQRLSVSFDADLGDEPPRAWAGEIEQLLFRGSRFMEEVVFLHRPSRTLVLADLIENFEAERLRPWARWLAWLVGNLDPDGKAPWDLRMTFLGRKQQARASLARMLAWQPERILLAHGRWYPEHGTAELRRAFRWLGPPT